MAERDGGAAQRELDGMRAAAKILGDLPPGALGSQEPVYRAYQILAREIERIEQAAAARTQGSE